MIGVPGLVPVWPFVSVPDSVSVSDFLSMSMSMSMSLPRSR
jgi:hypothetical protein